MAAHASNQKAQRSLFVLLSLVGATSLALSLAQPTSEAPPSIALPSNALTTDPSEPAQHAATSDRPAADLPRQRIPSSTKQIEASTQETLPSDLLVQVEALGMAPTSKGLDLTRTTAELVSEVLLQRSADDHGCVRLARTASCAHQPGDVVCVDASFPTVGAYAMQVEPHSERMHLFLPEQARLRIAVEEADGASLHVAARAEVRVLTATPPADRMHTYAITNGQVDVPVEAAGLLLEVQIVTRDGRRAEPVTLTGPVQASSVTDCMVTMAPRTMFTARLHDALGKPLRHARVEVRLAYSSIRLDEGATTDESGIMSFPAPQLGREQAWPLHLLATSGTDRLLHAELLANLSPGAATMLGDVWLQATVPLVSGTCVDEDGKPLANTALLVQVERAEQRPPGGMFAPTPWWDLAQSPTVTDKFGAFTIHGPPSMGRPMRLRVQGRPDVITPFSAGATDLSLVVTPPRSRLFRRK